MKLQNPKYSISYLGELSLALRWRARHAAEPKLTQNVVKDQDKLWNLNLQKMQKLIFLSYFGKCETVTFNHRCILHPNIPFDKSGFVSNPLKISAFLNPDFF